MYLLKGRENGSFNFKLSEHEPFTVLPRMLFESLTGEEKPARLWLGAGLLVLLLHVWLILYLQRPTEPITPAQPLMMQVSLIAAPASKPPAAAPKVQAVKQVPPPVPKKTPPKPLITKKPRLASKPSVIPKPTPVPALTPPSAPVPNKIDLPPSMTTHPAAPAAKAPAPKSEPFTDANYRANYDFNPKPEYPRLARSRGWQGKVLLRVQVSAEGVSESVAVQNSSGHEALDEAAVAAVKKWKFIPARRGDTPVASSVTVPINFTLHE